MSPSSAALLKRLHEQSNDQVMGRARAQFHGTNEAFLALARQYEALAPRLKGRFLDTHGLSTDDSEASQGTTLSLAVSEHMGCFLHQMVLSHRPLRILELGSSYGVSTLYFAEALRTLGRGTVIATERDAEKCAHIRAHVETAGLELYVDLREGDVFETVSALDSTFDIVFMDVWASTYLALFKRIEGRLRPGSIVIADNMYTAGDDVRPYKQYVDRHPRFSSMTLDFESGVELTVAR